MQAGDTDSSKQESHREGQQATLTGEAPKTNTDMSNVLKHIQDLEGSNTDLKRKLQEALDRNGKLSQKTREGMQSALDSLMKKWMDAVET